MPYVEIINSSCKICRETSYQSKS